MITFWSVILKGKLHSSANFYKNLRFDNVAVKSFAILKRERETNMIEPVGNYVESEVFFKTRTFVNVFSEKTSPVLLYVMLYT